ncbi:MAG: glycoside hydrolase family 88 protein [Cytophagales bacterium]|nr:glycoside hydrolase family 88 protein [Armatimonadota bacterium]
MKLPTPPNNSTAIYHRATVTERDPSISVSSEQRIPFGWPAFAVPPRREAPGVILRWKEPLRLAAPARLRVTVALDVREAKRIEARTALTGEPLGVFDIRYASVCQPFEVTMAPEVAARAVREGVRLRQEEGERPLWLFDGESSDTPEAFAPHFLGAVSGDRWGQFEARLCSSASLQAFGWIEGCVLDGLWQMARLPGGEAARKAVTAHLRRFVSPGGDLSYEGPGSAPQRNRTYGMEGLLPFAIIAQSEPQNPVLKLAEQEIRARLDKDNAVIDHDRTTTEGVYIAGYPLAALARAWKRDDLAALALAQLRTRRDRSVIQGKIYQNVGRGGDRAFLPNWARGVAWYLLGFARVLETLELGPGAEAADLHEEFRRAARWALPFQRADGLWGNFLDDPHAGVDTSGSAGIATALAIGARCGWLPGEAQAAARRTEAGLEAFLTPDGFLGGMAQFNKGGEALQRAPYRVMAPMAMGLAAQLRAALRAADRGSVKPIL